MEQSADQEFLEYLVKSLVDHPEVIKIERKVDDRGVCLNLTVHAEDMGQIVGREGKTAKAIRSLLRIVGMKNNAHVSLKILEPEGSTHSTSSGQAHVARAPRAEVEPEGETKTLRPGDPIADEMKL